MADIKIIPTVLLSPESQPTYIVLRFMQKRKHPKRFFHKNAHKESAMSIISRSSCLTKRFPMETSNGKRAIVYSVNSKVVFLTQRSHANPEGDLNNVLFSRESNRMTSVVVIVTPLMSNNRFNKMVANNVCKSHTYEVRFW